MIRGTLIELDELIKALEDRQLLRILQLLLRYKKEYGESIMNTLMDAAVKEAN